MDWDWIAFGTWLAVAYVCAFAFVGAALALRKHRRAAPLSVAAALFFASVGTVTAQKGGGTNEPPRLAAHPVRAAAQTPRPSAPAKVAKINARGAWRDSFLLDFGDDFLFPFGTNRLSSVEIFSQGYARPRRRSAEFVADTGLRAAIVPGVSSISVELTPSNSWRVEWTDAAQNRDTNTLVSASIELMRNGDVAVTTNGVTRTIPRVHPHDLDGDGIPDALDANPGVCDGDLFGPQDALPPGANTNAYCWVDLVVHDADAEVVFSGDGYSDLADPHFMARAEVTNRVTILIGKGYEVTCDEAIECVGVSDEAIEVWNHDERSLHVSWPVMIEYIDGDEPQRGAPLLRSRGAALRGNGAPGGLSRRMRVVPDWLGGEFVWATNHCCGVSMSGFSLLWNCGGDCGCNGCEVCGDYVYESYRIYAFGGSCGCVPAEQEEPYRMEVSASQSAVFFEKGTANWQTSDLSCSYQTDCAGTFTLTYSGDSCVVRDSSLQTVSSGFTWDVDGACEGDMHFTVWSPTRSSSPSGTQFTVEFTPDGGGSPMTGSANVTFVEWETETVETWPVNRSRKELGVGERVHVTFDPMIAFTSFASENQSGSVTPGGMAAYMYTAPTNACTDVVSFATASGSGFSVSFSILEPTGNLVVNITSNVVNQVNVAGNFEILFDLVLMPTNVSFSGRIQIVEVGVVSTNAVGYFADPSREGLLDHGQHGANVWITVGEHNSSGSDTVSPGSLLPPFSDGSFTWPIPNHWRMKGDFGSGKLFCNDDQHFAITTSGTSSVWKFGRKGVRMLNSDTLTITEEAIP